jgi:DNA polymerase-1
VRRRGHPSSEGGVRAGAEGDDEGVEQAGDQATVGPDGHQPPAAADLVDRLRRVGIGRGDLVALAIAPTVGLGLATAAGLVAVPVPVTGGGDGHGDGGDGPAELVRAVDDALRPRWVWWANDTAATLVAAGVRVATCWDVAAVARLLFGGWRADPARVWAQVHDLALDSIPTTGPPDLFTLVDDDDDGEDDHDDGVRDRGGPVRADGHLRPGWVTGGWAASPERLAAWAGAALEVATRQQARLSRSERPTAPATARSESAAELLCAELSADGLPVDRAEAEAIVASYVGPRPRTEADAAAQRARRDAQVLRHAPAGSEFDLRSPGQVKSLLRRVGIEVADTRAWRLESLRDAHPLVDALLAWRKAERVATTYGYAWLDEHVGPDGRLRGDWSGSDGAAGRMTATAGLHSMPADLRGAVVAEPGHVFVRADLGQIEPRVLAAVSGDAELARATAEDDMYAPVAEHLGVDRATAKVAVLGAMYGQTTGRGAQVLRRLEQAYPVAMAYLADGDRGGQVGRSLRTYGGRLIPMGTTNANEVTEREARSRAAARGRYGRNALVQGAAAELFKVWAVTVRARAAPFDARIVLCLHDELLVHTPADRGERVARLVDDCLQEAAHRWAPDGSVRFVADTSTIPRWSDAKA